MSPVDIQVNVEDVILKPIGEVFGAIIDPDKLARFFISGASGPLREGETVQWSFADVDTGIAVAVTEVVEPRRIVFVWEASGVPTQVEILLKAIDGGATAVRITEDGWEMDEDGVLCALGQTQGWTDFLCSMKAFLYCGIKLREGITGDMYGAFEEE